MKNILYFMHVPWGWIKQRPHFLAEELAVSHNISVAYIKPYFVRNLTQEKCSLENFVLHQFPLSSFNLIKKINIFLITLQINYICKLKNIDTIWITDVRLYCYLKYIRLKEKKIYLIYDCMDDTLAFPKLAKNKDKITALEMDERALLESCNVVFASSETLLKQLKNISTFRKQQKNAVINNALDDKGQEIIPLGDDHPFSKTYQEFKEQSFIVLIYVGTIASWLDIQTINQSLTTFSNIAYLLVGPSEINLPIHERIVHIKPVEHIYVKYIMHKADILVMPFVLNKLIASVDPVKMYEYISCNKPIIAIEYAETLKFAQYTHLYSSSDEYCRYINETIISTDISIPFDRLAIRLFINENTWKQRVEKINSIIES